MPNWCHNKVEINGSINDVTALVEKGMQNKEKEFSMECFFPTPEEDNGEPFKGWYGWRVANWGTKWDMSEPRLEKISPKVIQLDYETAWGPNFEFWESISADYPSLKINHRYSEGGCIFCGEFDYTKGEREEVFESDCNSSQEYHDALIDIRFNDEAEYVAEYIAEEEAEELMSVGLTVEEVAEGKE